MDYPNEAGRKLMTKQKGAETRTEDGGGGGGEGDVYTTRKWPHLFTKRLNFTHRRKQSTNVVFQGTSLQPYKLQNLYAVIFIVKL